jgi:predicted SAM-dependent methyltransferase
MIMKFKKHIKDLMIGYKKLELRILSRRRIIKIVIGASLTKYSGWVPTEMNFLNLLKEEDWKFAFRKNSISAILAEHVWEHLTQEEGLLAVKRCHDYLMPGGHLRIAVPDGFHPEKAYIEYVRPGGHGAGADDHKVLYNFISLSKQLEEVGFEVRLLEWFDGNGQFHYQEWNPNDGMVVRSSRFDERNADGKLNYTSLIIDGIKK